MSWKSLVTASLLCVLASPAFAAPTINAVGGGANASGFLDANGNWVYKIQISNSNPVPTGSSPLAAELGFTTSGALVSAANLSVLNSGTGFDKSNPGTQIFGWEAPGTGTNNKPEGVQTNTGLKQVFSALGSQDFNTVGPHDYISIVTAGPTSTSLTSTVTVSGAYSGKGRIAELDSGGAAVNSDTYNNVFTFTALDGDTNLDGHRNGFDVGPFLAGFAAGTGKWFNGDYTGDGLVNGFDTGHLLTGLAGGPPGSGSGSAVPEPASIALLGLAMLGGLGVFRRKR